MSKQIGRMVVRDAQRMFDGGTATRLTRSFDGAGYTIDQITFSQLEVLRNRARQQGRNNDYVRRFRQLLRNNVLGHAGFSLRSMVIDQQGKPDRLAREAIEQSWKKFCKQQRLSSKLRAGINALPTDGEFIVYTELHSDGMKIKLLDPALLDVSYNQSEKGRPLIRFGIEYNDFDEPSAYHFNTDYSNAHPGAGQVSSASIQRTRIPADQIHHVFFEEWVGQRRGFPWVASSMSRLFQANQLEHAAVTAHRIGAAKMGFFSSKDDDEYTGDGEGDEMTLNAEAGTFENIGSMDFTPFDPSYPAGEFTAVHDQHMRATSSGWGVDFHTLANKLSDVNYSSARVGLLETREFYKELQQWLIDDLIEHIFSKHLESELLRGRICVQDKSGKNRPLSRNIAYYLPANFVGRRWDWVDPQKEAQGKKIQWEMRTLSLSQIIRERGDDPESVFQEIANDQKRMDELGIKIEQVMNHMEKPSAKDE